MILHCFPSPQWFWGVGEEMEGGGWGQGLLPSGQKQIHRREMVEAAAS